MWTKNKHSTVTSRNRKTVILRLFDRKRTYSSTSRENSKKIAYKVRKITTKRYSIYCSSRSRPDQLDVFATFRHFSHFSHFSSFWRKRAFLPCSPTAQDLRAFAPFSRWFCWKKQARRPKKWIYCEKRILAQKHLWFDWAWVGKVLSQNQEKSPNWRRTRLPEWLLVLQVPSAHTIGRKKRGDSCRRLRNKGLIVLPKTVQKPYFSQNA